MRIVVQRSLVWFSLCFVLFTHSVFAYQFKDTQSGRLAEMVSKSLTDLRTGRPTDLKAINQLFNGLDRGKIDLEDLVELKYLMAHYRASIVKALVPRFEKADDGTKLTLLEDLENARGYISGAQRDLIHKYTTVALSAPALAPNGEILTPSKLLFYDDASFSKKYENDKWLGDPELDLSHYGSVGLFTVSIRGLEVKAGDVVILDQGKTGGVNTNFSVPRSYASHMGLVVFIEHEGKTYPAFFEIAERGLRVIPLNVVFSAPFSLYAEVYRPTIPAGDLRATDFGAWAKQLSADVMDRLMLPYIYDYYNPKIETGKEFGVVCSTQVQLFLMRNGVRCHLPADQIDDRAKGSLRSQFDFHLEEYITPTSYLEAGNSEFEFIGSVETGLSPVNTVRELVIGTGGEVAPESLGYLFSHYDLDLGKMELKDKAKFDSLATLAPLLISSGMYSVNAPPKVLAFAKLLNDPLTETVDSLMQNYDGLIEPDPFVAFSLHDRAQDPKVQALLKTKLATLRHWFGK